MTYDDTPIDTIEGEMSGTVWHIGCHLALSPNGWNWRVDGKPTVQRLLNLLGTGGYEQFGQGVATFSVNCNLHHPLASVVIQMSEPPTGSFGRVVLSSKGRDVLLGMCREALNQKDIPHAWG